MVNVNKQIFYNYWVWNDVYNKKLTVQQDRNKKNIKEQYILNSLLFELKFRCKLHGYHPGTILLFILSPVICF